MLPWYDITKTFTENTHQLQHIKILPYQSSTPPQYSLFDSPLNSKIGVPACCVTTGHGIALLSQLGFDVLTYKTVRGHYAAAHPLPNVMAIQSQQIDLTHPKQIFNKIDFPAAMNLSNSFGNACFDSKFTQNDIAFAKQSLRPGQVLIVSIYEEETHLKNLIKHYLNTAAMVREAGADIIELNFSCPNVNFATNLSNWIAITNAIKKAFPALPLLAKLAYQPQFSQLKKILVGLAQAGINGICGINSYPIQVIEFQRPSGLSGNALRPLALDFIRDARGIISHQRLDLTLLGTGGITQPQHFQQFFAAGADIALSATGTLYNPYLAIQYRQNP